MDKVVEFLRPSGGPLGDRPSQGWSRLVNPLSPAQHPLLPLLRSKKPVSCANPPNPLPTPHSPSPQALPASLRPRRLARLAALITLILKIHKVRSGSFLSLASSLSTPHPLSILSGEKAQAQGSATLLPSFVPAGRPHSFQRTPFPSSGCPSANT